MDRRVFLKNVGAGLGVFALGAPIARTDAGRKVLLDGFIVRKQQTPYTCGPASARMVLEYLGHPVLEPELAKRMHTSPHFGTSHGQLIRAYRKYLAEFNTGLEARIIRGKEVTDDLVMESLEDGLPLIASFVTENHFKPGTAVGHYCVIIGMDLDANVLTLANPFGYKEIVNIERFWRLAKWKPGPGDLPDNLKGSRLLVFPLPRTLIALERMGCACRRRGR